MMRVLPSELLKVIYDPRNRPSERSSGVATDEAMVSGDAPGSEALIINHREIDCGSGATGRGGIRDPHSVMASE
ncbi:hypothetical protein ACNKHQ_12350 [Shigella flexneri]